MGHDLFQPGATAVVRGIFNGRARYEQAVRVLDSGASSVTSARWPGAAMRRMPLSVEPVQTGDRELRTAASQARARGNWTLANAAWQRSSVVEQVESDRWFSISSMYGPDGDLVLRYVNFERPPVWRPNGWDTNDLALDLVVEPDGTWRWKDEDEYAHDRKLGLITDAEHASVQQARDQAVALIEARTGLFDEDTDKRWLPDPTWPTPSLSS